MKPLCFSPSIKPYTATSQFPLFSVTLQLLKHTHNPTTLALSINQHQNDNQWSMEWQMIKHWFGWRSIVEWNSGVKNSSWFRTLGETWQVCVYTCVCVCLYVYVHFLLMLFQAPCCFSLWHLWSSLCRQRNTLAGADWTTRYRLPRYPDLFQGLARTPGEKTNNK